MIAAPTEGESGNECVPAILLRVNVIVSRCQSISVSCKMAGTHSFPLSPSVGAAIIRYLKEVRPKSLHRQVFLTRRAPVGPISNGAMWAVVSRQLRKRAPSLKHHGPHS